MKKIFPFALLFLLSITMAGCNKQTSALQNNNEVKAIPEAANTNIKISNDYPIPNSEQIADKLEVYYFHRTQRCYSCKTIGQFVRETMEQKYSQQIKNGTIDFRELNVELPENKETARRFQASGSSLFINRIKDGGDNIEQDNNVWRLLNNEEKFKSYLENKINSYLGI